MPRTTMFNEMITGFAQWREAGYGGAAKELNRMANPDLDVVTFGETMIRLSPPGHARLESTELLECRTGGSESNTAIALARIGRRAAWWSRLPDNPLGCRIANQITRWGVDTSHILWAPDGRAGLYFIEFGASPRPHHVYYDRAGSAISQIEPDMVDWAHLDRARHLHLTGITPALSSGCAATVERAAREAGSRSMTISFDLNYRSKLWSPAQARSTIEPLLQLVDLLFCPLADAEVVLNVTGHAADVARELQQRYCSPQVVVTGAADGVCAVDGEVSLTVANVPAVAVDRIGSGDAGNAGILHGFLEGDLATGLRYGAAMAALKLSIPGDELIASRAEIEAVVSGEHVEVRR